MDKTFSYSLVGILLLCSASLYALQVKQIIGYDEKKPTHKPGINSGAIRAQRLQYTNRLWNPSHKGSKSKQDTRDSPPVLTKAGKINTLNLLNSKSPPISRSLLVVAGALYDPQTTFILPGDLIAGCGRSFLLHKRSPLLGYRRR
jgi:hypothetical protein